MRIIPQPQLHEVQWRIMESPKSREVWEHIWKKYPYKDKADNTDWRQFTKQELYDLYVWIINLEQ